MKIILLIQGPTNYFNDIIKYYGHLENVIWTTWKNDKYKNDTYENIKMNYIEMPQHRGYHNINLQCKSIIEGLKIINDKKCYILKIRSDIIIKNIEKLITYLANAYNNKISILCPQNTLYHHNISIRGQYWIVDYITFGNYDDTYKLWNYYETDKNTIPAELKLTKQFVKNIKDKIEFKKYFDFFINYIVHNNIDIFWLSHKDHRFQHNKEYKNCVYLNKYIFEDYYRTF